MARTRVLWLPCLGSCSACPVAHLFIAVVEVRPKQLAERLTHIALVRPLEGKVLELPGLALQPVTMAEQHGASDRTRHKTRHTAVQHST